MCGTRDVPGFSTLPPPSPPLSLLAAPENSSSYSISGAVLEIHKYLTLIRLILKSYTSLIAADDAGGFTGVRGSHSPFVDMFCCRLPKVDDRGDSLNWRRPAVPQLWGQQRVADYGGGEDGCIPRETSPAGAYPKEAYPAQSTPTPQQQRPPPRLPPCPLEGLYNTVKLQAAAHSLVSGCDPRVMTPPTGHRHPAGAARGLDSILYGEVRSAHPVACVARSWAWSGTSHTPREMYS